MVIAPHPDDESLATGGLLQRANRSGAQTRVVFASDGGNNPWPQRVLERRWRIGGEERLRWGRRRQHEALSALHCLGMQESGWQSLGFRDQECTMAFLDAPADATRRIRHVIEDWHPTLVIAPSIHDRHPDHSALSILTSMAVESLPGESRPELIHYVVHGRQGLSPTPCLNLHLRQEERQAKLDAILCHETQMALSRKRFTAYASDREQFHYFDSEDEGHPVRIIDQKAGALCVRVARAKVPFVPGELWIACDGQEADRIRWRIPLRSRRTRVPIESATSAGPARSATIREIGRDIEIKLPLRPLTSASRLFIKLHRRIGFYDEAGWREIVVPDHAPASCSDPLPSETLLSSFSFAASFSGGDSEPSV